MKTKVNQLNRVLNNFREEDGVRLERSLAELRKNTQSLGRELLDMISFEENTLFPFLRTHIPRLETLIRILLVEHEELKRVLKELASGLCRLEKSGPARAKGVQKIKDDATYLVCLLRIHLWIKHKNLYGPVRLELKPQEKKRLRSYASVYPGRSFF